MPPNTLRVNTEYVLVKSVSSKVLWAEMTSVAGLENVSLPFNSVPKLWRWRMLVSHHLSPLQEFIRAKSYCHLHGAQG
ncbi:hypothetical protein TNCV_919911 [Trichonephila clavipes]|nr:hypothetical protein TNCV_919911 [Trichonephila clavipes]